METYLSNWKVIEQTPRPTHHWYSRVLLNCIVNGLYKGLSTWREYTTWKYIVIVFVSKIARSGPAFRPTTSNCTYVHPIYYQEGHKYKHWSYHQPTTPLSKYDAQAKLMPVRRLAFLSVYSESIWHWSIITPELVTQMQKGKQILSWACIYQLLK